MRANVARLDELTRKDIALVGGKGANLGELTRIDGVRVPAGFCITASVFQRVVAPLVENMLGALEPLDAKRAMTMRNAIESVKIPDDVRAEVKDLLVSLGELDAYAVRSSATAEDLPDASFAGQQDTYLDVVSLEEILKSIRRCWASLFTDRAVAYRAQQGFDHRKVQMAVVVQKMVRSFASGTLFTAHPINGNRKVSSVEAVFGLGEALVSGHVNADGYSVREGQLVEKRVAPQHAAQVLSDAQVLELASLGRKIEAHFGQPQDIEWCLADDVFHVVQSRPITTLFPIPQSGVDGNRVYLSVAHQQMMTDPMKPLGLSVWQMLAARPMFAAGGRLFVDPTRELSSPTTRAIMLNAFGSADPLITDALTTLINRGFFDSPSGETAAAPPPRPPAGAPPPPLEDDPSVVTGLIAANHALTEKVKQDIQGKTGNALIEFILDDIQRLKQLLMDPMSTRALMAGLNASKWIQEQMLAWLGEKGAADALSQSVANNVTAEMGLELMDVADAIRPHPEVIAYLERATDEGFLDGLLPLPGGKEAHEALRAYLEKYGMRCAGEIDLTRKRWSESPTTLVPLILSSIKSVAPGERARRFEHGRQTALKKEQELLTRLKALPDGENKAEETRKMIHRLRTFIGYREYPKYGLIKRITVYRHALLDEGKRLVNAGVVRDRSELDFLTIQELRELVRTQKLDEELVKNRKQEHARNGKLSPPRIITSDGEIISGAYHRTHVPEGALVGIAVSSGVVEGRARVISEMSNARMEVGDILVTAFTDPGWTPLFVSISGLVTEVGGLMTHGAVIAREYGLPAVVGVDNATRLIKDGQRIRVHGSEGYVELLA